MTDGSRVRILLTGRFLQRFFNLHEPKCCISSPGRRPQTIFKMRADTKQNQSHVAQAQFEKGIAN
ncbi:hypothetical protein EYF80_031541 [Liparis tanakae]|uniref:Uncharacterized protein n=1 Tax=Liparis tanakae TaxID=230148 RepID=A0A4Z2GXQ8_9TELE|nr:hypothetical protein EYF80_031541 [Liparis tanakae]